MAGVNTWIALIFACGDGVNKVVSYERLFTTILGGRRTSCMTDENLTLLACSELSSSSILLSPHQCVKYSSTGLRRSAPRGSPSLPAFSTEKAAVSISLFSHSCFPLTPVLSLTTYSSVLYTDTKLLLRDEGIKISDICRLDLKWVRANTKVFLELLFVGLGWHVRAELAADTKADVEDSRQEDKVVWCKSEVTGRAILGVGWMRCGSNLVGVLGMF